VENRAEGRLEGSAAVGRPKVCDAAAASPAPSPAPAMAMPAATRTARVMFLVRFRISCSLFVGRCRRRLGTLGKGKDEPG
jgi:hypothetical protein